MHAATFRIMSLCLGLLLPAAVWSQDATTVNTLQRMPVRELTVFKDGHAFVMHRGTLPTDANGNVAMDYLPAPVLGTFWPFADQEGAKLRGVTAGKRRVTLERTPLTIPELIEANLGAEVVITEVSSGQETAPLSYPAKIIRLTEQSVEELERNAPPDSGDMLPKKGDVVLLETMQGTKAIPIARIQDVAFKEPPTKLLGYHEYRNLLTLNLDWWERKPPKTAEVGLMYVQRGVRWIPNYKISVDGKGTATIQFQATLLNELTDLEDVTCHLVVGVPSFRFKDMVDPISLQQGLAQLSSFFHEQNGAQGQFQMLYNSIMTQSVRVPDGPSRPTTADPVGNLGPDLDSGPEGVEDLHFFTILHITLRKGERMVVPIAEFTIPYEDVYVLDVPIAPPADVRRGFGDRQRDELARQLAGPKVMHNLRLTNTSQYPLTTAPALICRGGNVVAQSLMTYTSKGNSVDLPVTMAVDVKVVKSDREKERAPNAVRFDDYWYMRVDLEGSISLTNYRKEPVKLEVKRHVLGNVTKATQDGKFEKLNVFEDDGMNVPGRFDYPCWWGWYGWPYWWGRLNGASRISWETTLGAGRTAQLDYQWHYFWR